MSSKLKLKITSFSYKKGLPQTNSKHGGGFIFDCRCIENPGRNSDYQNLNGKNQLVAEFLKKLPAAQEFLKNILALVQQAATNYQSRNFELLEVSFGCTGGQHRSVYFAEQLAGRLSADKNVIIDLLHRDLPESTI